MSEEGYKARFWRLYPRLRNCFDDLKLRLDSPFDFRGAHTAMEEPTEAVRRGLSVGVALAAADREALVLWLATHLSRKELDDYRKSVVAEMEGVARFLEECAGRNRDAVRDLDEVFGRAYDLIRRQNK